MGESGLFRAYIGVADLLCRSGVPLENAKVIFNPPCTILIANGKKYIARTHNEDFDEEKGLLMCIAKANGITHLQLKRMIKGAQRPQKKTTNHTEE